MKMAAITGERPWSCRSDRYAQGGHDISVEKIVTA